MMRSVGVAPCGGSAEGERVDVPRTQYLFSAFGTDCASNASGTDCASGASGPGCVSGAFGPGGAAL